MWTTIQEFPWSGEDDITTKVQMDGTGYRVVIGEDVVCSLSDCSLALAIARANADQDLFFEGEFFFSEKDHDEFEQKAVTP